jgi:hypothetical protein
LVLSRSTAHRVQTYPQPIARKGIQEKNEFLIQAWSKYKAGIPIDDLGRRKIDEQLQLVPLFKEHVVIGKAKQKKK